MVSADHLKPAQQSNRFLYLYALAVSGGSVAYIPFLTIILPNYATTLSGKGALELLAYIAFVGAVIASAANILFGWASDKTRSRRPWILAGLFICCALLPLMQSATNPNMLIALIVIWQIGLNMMLAPLAAWAGDTVPDRQKGLLGGLLAFAPALGALSGALVTRPGLAIGSNQLLIVALLVALMVCPVLLFGRPTDIPQLTADNRHFGKIAPKQAGEQAGVIQMWIARLLIQIAEASLFTFLFIWFRSIDPNFADNDTASIFALILCASVVATLLIGRWSDHHDRPIFPLTVCAALAVAGLLIMAMANGLRSAVAGYALFGLSGGIFLALHSSQTLRVLPKSTTRGRDLGMFNLTNTIPSLIMPWLTMAMVPTFGFDALFILLAALAFVACLILAAMPAGAQSKNHTPL